MGTNLYEHKHTIGNTIVGNLADYLQVSDSANGNNITGNIVDHHIQAHLASSNNVGFNNATSINIDSTSGFTVTGNHAGTAIGQVGR